MPQCRQPKRCAGVRPRLLLLCCRRGCSKQAPSQQGSWRAAACSWMLRWHPRRRTGSRLRCHHHWFNGDGAEGSDSEDEYILAVQQKVEGQLEILLIDFDLAVTDFWTFITNQENNPKDRVEIDAYRATLLPKAVELAETAQKILAEHQCTYLHDVVYGLWMGAGVIGAYLRASMEGFEHANKVFGAIMRQQVSMGGRGERHGMIQALVLRRATTNSRIADNKVNEYSKARAVGVTDASEKRRMSIESALDAMRELKRELDEIERVPMESSDALGELEKLKI